MMLPQIQFSVTDEPKLTVPLPKKELVELKAHTLPANYFVQNSVFENWEDDENVRIGVTLKTLRKLQVFHESWVR